MKLTDWFEEMKERRRYSSFKRLEEQFFRHVRYGLYDFVEDSIIRNGKYPSVTGEQAQALWNFGFFQYAYRTGYREWHGVMHALKHTEWGKRQEWRLSGINAGNETLSQKLNAEYVLMCSRKDKSAHPLCPTVEPEEVRAAHRLLGYCMREQELLELKELALYGKRPGDVTLIRNGLLDGFRKIENLKQRRADEMHVNNHSAVYNIEVEIAEETGRLMRVSTGLYEKKTDEKFSEDYLEALRKEHDTLRLLSLCNWDEIEGDIPDTLPMKYGMVKDTRKVDSLMRAYSVFYELSNGACPGPDIKPYNEAIKSQSRKAVERLEKILYPKDEIVKQESTTSSIRQPAQGLQKQCKNERRIKI